MDVPERAGVPESKSPSAQRRQRPTRLIASIIVLVVALVGMVGVVLWSRKASDPVPIASSVTCPVYWQPADTVQPTHVGDLTAEIAHPALGPNEKSIAAGAMSVKVAVPNVDPGIRHGPGSDLSLGVTDGKGRKVYHQLFQISQGPVNEFGGNTGFTGLLYISDPETGAIVQLSCTAA